MKKTMKLALLICLALLTCTLIFTACDIVNKVKIPSNTTDGNTSEESTMYEATGSTTEPETETHIHEFGKWTTVKEATCTEKGEQKRVCTCGEKETQNIDIVAHTEITDKAVAPTCTATGLTEGKHCSVCNKVTLAQVEIPTSHNAPHGVCENCNKITDENAALNYYYSFTSNAIGSIFYTYWNGDVWARYYISDYSLDTSLTNTYDGRICLSITFDLDASISNTNAYYNGTGFLSYRIYKNGGYFDDGTIIVSGYSYTTMTVNYTIFFDYISSEEIGINLYDYDM